MTLSINTKKTAVSFLDRFHREIQRYAIRTRESIVGGSYFGIKAEQDLMRCGEPRKSKIQLEKFSVKVSENQ